MTSQWQPTLFCCPPPDLSTYGCWVNPNSTISPALYPYWYDDSPFHERKASWILGEKDGQVFFGRRGQVGDVMGWEYPAARDSVKRPLDFFLVYSAPAGTPLPHVSDFVRIEATMKEDIERFYAELTEAYPNTRNITPTPTAFDFARTQGEAASDHAWDKMASEIEGGKKSTLLVINQQGEVQTQDLARKPTPKSDDRASPSDLEQKKTEEPDQGSERNSSSGPFAGYSATAHTPSNTAHAFDGGQAAILVSLCAICVGGIAALLYKLRHKKDRQKEEQTQAPKAQQLALLSGQTSPHRGR
jgi:hypothetical protein